MVKSFATIGILLAGQLSMAQYHVKLQFNGKHANILKAVKKANEILASKAFYDEIRKIPAFDHSALTGQEIADRMEKATHEIKVVRRIKPIANAGTTTYDKIKISRSLFGIDTLGNFALRIAVNTLIHETVHAVDFLGTGDEFTHDGNKPDGQENTAPWVIGAIAEKMVEEEGGD